MWRKSQLTILRQSPKGQEPVVVVAVTPDDVVVFGVMERTGPGHLYLDDIRGRYKNTPIGRANAIEYFEDYMAQIEDYEEPA